MPEVTPFVSSLAHHAADPFRLLVESVVDYAIFMVDPAGNVASWNPGAERIYGYRTEQIVGQPVARLAVPGDDTCGEAGDGWPAVLREGRLERECRRVREGGGTFWAVVTTTNLKDFGGAHIGFAQVTRDITERKRLLHSLGERIKELTCLHEAAKVLHDRSQGIAEWFGAIAALVPPAWQYPEDTEVRIALGTIEVASPGFVRTPWIQRADFVDADGTPGCIEVVYRSEKPAEVEGPFLAEERSLIDSLAEMLRAAIDRHTAEQRARGLEDQVRHAQKMEAVGLAAGVAHDFNNVLTVIASYCDMMLRELRPEHALHEMVTEVRDAGERAGSLTHQLLAFSRRAVVAPRVVELNGVVRDHEKMLRRLIGEDVRLSVVLGEGLDRVRVDPGLIGQVILNLAVNARDAMPSGGSLTLETATAELDEVFAAAHPEVKTGRYVLLAVTDTGTGMTPEVQAHLFEPFFTTKEPGRGTGLGLATVHGIVQQSGGFIYVYSEPGRGSTFKCYFPVAEGRLPGGTPPQAYPAPHLGVPPALARGDETILVVEDDGAVRAALRRGLQQAGYTVLAASRAADALQIAEGHASPIHLLVTDVVMPDLGGRELAARVVAVRPEVKVLHLSGYTDDAVIRHGVLEAGVAFLQKPFTMTELAAKVRQVLDAGGSGRTSA